MEDFVIVKSTLWYWIKKYNEKGIEGLIFDKGGRKEGNPKWDKEIFDKLIKEIDKNDKLWSVPLMKEWIMKNNKIDIPQSTIWYHLQLKKYSYKSLRPSPYKGDEKAQEEFKKKDL
jgi:transposase